jgi:uracil-DNA glycosylase family 4
VEERVQRWARDVKRDVDTPDIWADLQREREILTGARYDGVEKLNDRLGTRSCPEEGNSIRTGMEPRLNSATRAPETTGIPPGAAGSLVPSHEGRWSKPRLAPKTHPPTWMDRLGEAQLASRGVLMEPKAPLAHCEECPLRDQDFVSGVGRDEARYVIVGEAPGATEVATGVPFTGSSGKELKKALALHRIDRNTDAFVTNTVLCRPPLMDRKNTSPDDAAVAACKDRLVHEIETHKPDAVLALGGPAAQTLLDSEERISDLRVGDPKPSPFFDPPVVATFHPSYARRNAGNLSLMTSDVGKLLEVTHYLRMAHRR